MATAQTRKDSGSKVEGFRLHLVDQLQDVRKLLDHAGPATMATDRNKEGFRVEAEGFRLLAGDKLSQKRDIK